MHILLILNIIFWTQNLVYIGCTINYCTPNLINGPLFLWGELTRVNRNNVLFFLPSLVILFHALSSFSLLTLRPSPLSLKNEDSDSIINSGLSISFAFVFSSIRFIFLFNFDVKSIFSVLDLRRLIKLGVKKLC